MVPVARVEEKGHARYWTVEAGRLLVGQSLAEVVGGMRRPRLSVGALSAMAGAKVSIWLTPYEGVHRLTFGHELHLTSTGPQVRRWFHPEQVATTSEDPAAVMRRAITGAIESATREVRGATVALSGGLDSTILLALAALDPRLGGNVHAYCAVPDPSCTTPVPGRTADEWSAAAAAAELAGIPAGRLTDDGFNWLDSADEFHARNLSPVLAAPNLWWLRRLEDQAVSNGHRVILTGASGNATFSHGRLHRMRPLLADGTHEQPARRTSLRVALRGRLRRSPPRAILPGIRVNMPEHILEMDPWTRWCLAEPPASANGPWTGANVVWKDPLGSPEVIAAAMSLPASAWGTSVSQRALARQVGVGLIPEHVRLNQVRGIQGTDLPGMMLRHANSYRSAVDRVSASESARQFLDTRVLRRGVDLLLVHGDLASAGVFMRTYLRPLAVGLFAAWWDENHPRVMQPQEVDVSVGFRQHQSRSGRPAGIPAP